MILNFRARDTRGRNKWFKFTYLFCFISDKYYYIHYLKPMKYRTKGRSSE